MDRLNAGLVAMAMVAFLLSASPTARAGVFTIADGNSTAAIDSDGSGMYNWTVDGVQHLNRQWFWFRTGLTGDESNVGSLPLTLSGFSDTNFDGHNETLFLRYAAAGLRIDLTFLMTGGSAGSGTSDIAESIKIVNTGLTPLDFHFYQYVNLHLNGSAVNDSVEIRNGNTAIQTVGSVVVSETVETPTASHCEVGFYPVTLSSFSDGLPTTLSDQGGMIGPGDLTWAFQWDTTIAPGSSYVISKDKHVVPEPATLGLLTLGSLALMKRRTKA